MTDTAWISLPSDAAGEPALGLINVSPTAPECMIMAGGAQHVDAFTGTALRVTVEYHGRVRQKRVVFGPPKDKETGRLLAGLLDNDLPRHFCLSNDAAVPDYGQPPRNILQPSTVVRTPTESDELADSLIKHAANYPRRAVRFLAGALATFAEPVLELDASSVGAVCTVMHNRETHALQLVITDLGIEQRESPDSGRELESMAETTGELENLERLTEQGQRLDLDLAIVLAAGAGRIRASSTGIVAVDDRYVEGFTTALLIQL